jgi:hypothetical protein
MPITPETKNWTWVLERTCDECGFDAPALDPSIVGALVRANAADWSELLVHPQASVRPNDDQWSAVEYACHVRDVFALYEQRLGWMLTQDGPSFPNWDQDVTAVEERYDLQDAAAVLSALQANAASLADLFDSVSGEQWQRPGFRSDGAAFTVDSFARYFIHDPVHHVGDVRKGYALLG